MLDETADAIAHELMAQGLFRGDRVALLGENSAEFLAAYLGIMRAGCVAVPINIKLPPAQIHQVLRDCQPRLCFADAVADSLCPAGLPKLSLAVSAIAQLPRRGAFAAVQPEAMEVAEIVYTSGSTGVPKGVMLTHAGQWALIDAVMGGDATAPYSGQRGIVAAPLFHMNGLMFSVMLMYARGAVVLLPRFRAEPFLDAISRFRIQIVTGVPPMMPRLAVAQALTAHDLSSVSVVLLGSAPLTVSCLEQTRALFPRAAILNGYGLTETGGSPFGPHPQGLPRPPYSVGYPLAHACVRLVGGDSPDEGTLEVLSPTNMTGYLNQPQATALKMRDGWVNTGDVMRRDADGFFYFSGRADDMFVCNGENVYPAQVERLLERHPAVSQAIVVPVDDVLRGSMPVAFVITQRESVTSEEELRTFACSHGPAYLHPRRVFFVETFPLSGVNKIDRIELRQRAQQLLSSG